MSDVTSGNWVSQGQRAWIRAAAPVTSDAAYDVPEIRTEPPEEVPPSTCSPGATRKWWLRRSPDAQTFSSITHTLPGRLEKVEITPSRPTDPTTMKDGA